MTVNAPSPNTQLVVICAASVVVGVVTLTIGLGAALVLCAVMAAIVIGVFAALFITGLTDPSRLARRRRREQSDEA